MRNFTIFFCLLSISLNVNSQSRIIQRGTLNRVQNVSSEYRDKNWDWTLNNVYTLIGTNNQTYTVRLPYYSSTGPASVLNNSLHRDIQRVDGWELILRDFGPIQTPFYILYNKYRGILRYFYFYPFQNTYTKTIGKLSFNDTKNTIGCFALSNSVPLDEYTKLPEVSQTSIGRLEPMQWNYLDFDISGYDPSVTNKQDPTFKLELGFVTETSIVINGDITFEYDITASRNTNTSSNVFNDAMTYGDGIVKRFSDVTSTITSVKELSKKESNSWWGNIANTMSIATSGNFFGQISKISSLFSYLILGGSSSATLPAPLLKKGDVKLKGSLTTQNPYGTLIIRVPGSIHMDVINDKISNILPLYDQPTGLFNLATKPIVENKIYHNQIESNNYVESWEETYEYKLTNNTYVFNTNIFSNANIDYGYIESNKESSYINSIDFFNLSKYCFRQSREDVENPNTNFDIFTGTPPSRAKLGVSIKLNVKNTTIVNPTNIICVFGYSINDLIVDYIDPSPLYRTPKKMTDVGLIESESKNTIFPNPAKDHFYFSPQFNVIQKIKIYNALGNVVKTITKIDINDNVDVSNLADGIYFIQFNIDNKVYTEKLIVSK